MGTLYLAYWFPLLFPAIPLYWLPWCGIESVLFEGSGCSGWSFRTNARYMVCCKACRAIAATSLSSLGATTKGVVILFILLQAVRGVCLSTGVLNLLVGGL